MFDNIDKNIYNTNIILDGRKKRDMKIKKRLRSGNVVSNYYDRNSAGNNIFDSETRSDSPSCSECSSDSYIDVPDLGDDEPKRADLNMIKEKFTEINRNKRIIHNNGQQHPRLMSPSANDMDGPYAWMFGEQKFDNGSLPVAMNEVYDKRGKGANTAKNEMLNDISLRDGFSIFDEGKDMRYGIVNDMYHNNMVPFFSSKAYGNDPYRD